MHYSYDRIVFLVLTPFLLLLRTDYYHTMFIKDKPQLAHMIRKGGEPAAVSNPTANPTAYASVPAGMAESMALKHSMASSMHAQVQSRLMGLSFPGKLHYLLCHGVYDLGLEGIMRWQPGGHAFAIHSSEDFEIQGLVPRNPVRELGVNVHDGFRVQQSHLGRRPRRALHTRHSSKLAHRHGGRPSRRKR